MQVSVFGQSQLTHRTHQKCDIIKLYISYKGLVTMARVKMGEFLNKMRKEVVKKQNEQEEINIKREVRKVFDWRNKEALLHAHPSTAHYMINSPEARELRRHITLREFDNIAKNESLKPLWNINYRNEGYIKGTDEEITRLGNMKIYEPINNIYAVKVRDEIEEKQSQASEALQVLKTNQVKARTNLFFLEGSFPPKESINGQQVFDFIVNNFEYIAANQFKIGEVKINNNRLESETIKTVEKRYELDRFHKEKDLIGALKDSGRFHPSAMKNKGQEHSKWVHLI